MSPLCRWTASRLSGNGQNLYELGQRSSQSLLSANRPHDWENRVSSGLLASIRKDTQVGRDQRVDILVGRNEPPLLNAQLLGPAH